jgi:peroxiredoxin
MKTIPAMALVLFVGLGIVRAETPPNSVGKKIDGFQLKDASGKSVALEQFRDRKAMVVIFAGTECPINNAYMPRLVELDKEYASKGVQLLLLNANVQDTPARIAAHAKKHDLPFPVLKDAGNKVADLFAARRTPEAFVLDSERIIRYQGRIDDQYGVGYSRAKATRRDLAVALDEVLAGKPVSQAATPVAGCLIARVRPAKESGAITFTKHIAPILQKNCQECHRTGQIGPMPLVTYDDAVSWADTIREVLDEQRMPPWFADPRYGHFANDRRLDPKDREALLRWLAEGTPKGDDKDLPPPATFAEGWVIGKPDQIVTMEDAFEVPADTPKGGIPYKYFTVDPKFTEDRWVTRAEAKPDATAVVHHIIVFFVPPGTKFSPRLQDSPVLCGTAPGDMPLILPSGAGKLVPKGSKLVFQMHYTPNGAAQKDRSSVGLVFAKDKEKVKRDVRSVGVLYPPAVHIPAGADNHKVELNFTFRNNGIIYSFMPHMHLRGKDFLYEVTYPDGKTETLLSVPRYNFNWQSVYRLQKPLEVPKGTKLHCVAHFDNSAKNPNNPDPSKEVFWGDQTWQEMAIGWMDVSFEQPKKQ